MINVNEETEQKIKNAAREIFLEKGKDGARMQAIADRAGVNKALVHYYFRSKEKLYLAILKDILEEIIGRLINIPEETPFKDFLRIFISNHIDFLVQNKNLLNFIIWELRDDKNNIHAFIQEIIQTFKPAPRDFVFKRITRAIQNNEIRRVNPVHLIMNVISLDFFPFAAFPIFMSIFDLSEKEMIKMLEERKQEVFRLIWNDIKLTNEKESSP